MDTADTQLETKLAAIRAERAKLAAQREAQEAQAELARELAEEQQALADDKALAACVDKYGAVGVELAVVDTRMGAVIVRRPTSTRYKRFQDKGSFTSDDIARLVTPCIVHPDTARADEILEQLPATAVRLANAIAVLAGQRNEELQKK